ncbi:MAG: response regulator transcription factor [Flavobacteriales bacterium]|jgi:two-component system LytT family response regulator|nr:response regulator transcription factor [Flavobacteriales bacterium]MBP7448671.1 response regulator transcription factor [Flavobacteriales bacterium]
MINALVVDDEPESRENIRGLLRMYCPQVNVVAAVGSIDHAEAAIELHRPDLIFLDIEMPNGNGFDLLDRFDAPPADVVFVTAYEQYALNAIKRYALDYILKPINVDELVRAVERKLALDAPQRERMGLMRTEQRQADDTKRIALPSAKGLQLVAIADIVRCEADDHYTTFHLVDKKRYVVTRNLGEYEEMLAPHGFFRVHHAHVVNLARVKQYVRGRGGYVIMDDGGHVDVSARRRDAFLVALAR